jgi:hypothetical protein
MIADPGFLLVASADNSKIVSNDLSKTNSEEFGGLIAESIAYYGTYTVNETEKIVILHLDANIPEPGRKRSRTNYHRSYGG